MPHHIDGNLMLIKHLDNSSESEILADLKAMEAFAATAQETLIVAHDATDMLRADEAYARQYGAAMQHVKKYGVHHVACVPKALPRVFAATAGRLAGIDMRVVKTCDEIERVLSSEFGVNVSRFDEAKKIVGFSQATKN